MTILWIANATLIHESNDRFRQMSWSWQVLLLNHCWYQLFTFISFEWSTTRGIVDPSKNKECCFSSSLSVNWHRCCVSSLSPASSAPPLSLSECRVRWTRSVQYERTIGRTPSIKARSVWCQLESSNSGTQNISGFSDNTSNLLDGKRCWEAQKKIAAFFS